MCGISRSIRTSTSMTRARHTFLRTSASSSDARKNRFCGRPTTMNILPDSDCSRTSKLPLVNFRFRTCLSASLLLRLCDLTLSTEAVRQLLSFYQTAPHLSCHSWYYGQTKCRVTGQCIWFDKFDKNIPSEYITIHRFAPCMYTGYTSYEKLLPRHLASILHCLIVIVSAFNEQPSFSYRPSLQIRQKK